MDLISIIENYVELGIRKINLERDIANFIKYQKCSEIEGGIAFSEGDYDRESSYNYSVKVYSDREADARKELNQVIQLLDFAHQSYNDVLSTMDEDRIIEVIDRIQTKREDLQRQIDELSKRKEWANGNGDIAFSIRDYSLEKEYNNISSECYREICKLQPRVLYYQSFIENLLFKIETKSKKK